MAGTVGPSLAAVWVVAWTGMERLLAKVRSFWVVRTLWRVDVSMILLFHGSSFLWLNWGCGVLEEGVDVHVVEFVDCRAKLLLQVADTTDMLVRIGEKFYAYAEVNASNKYAVWGIGNAQDRRVL